MKFIKLNNGIEMPMLGIGTFNLSPDQAERSVAAALKDGYRLIDTANAYDIFDFALSDEEMAELTAIDRDERFADY